MVDVKANLDVYAYYECYSPLHLCKNVKVAELLVRNGLSVDVDSEEKFTPLHTCKNEEVAEFLIKNEADINIKNNRGYAPLYYYALFDKSLRKRRHIHSERIIKLLIGAKADLRYDIDFISFGFSKRT